MNVGAPSRSHGGNGRFGLTRRGFALVAVGSAALLVGLLGGGDGWQQVGVLLLAIPLVSAMVLRRTRLRLQAARTIAPPSVPAGEPAAITLRVRSSSHVPTGVLRLQDVIEQANGRHPRFTVDARRGRWERRTTYRIRPRRRGRLTIGPLIAHTEDPFGCVAMTHVVAPVQEVLVTPPVSPLPAIRLPGEWRGSGELRPRSTTIAGQEDVTVRPYQRGDDRRRVHWRASARYDQLMVRQEELPWHYRATLVLDTRADGFSAWPGATNGGRDDPFEWAVRAAASIGAHLISRSVAIRLLTDDPDAATALWHDRAAEQDIGETGLLDALATVKPRPSASVRSLQHHLHHVGTSGGLVVAVLGRLSRTEVQQLALPRHEALAGIAVLLDDDVSAAGLTAGGWRVAMADGEQSLAEVWRSLDPLGSRPLITGAGEESGLLSESRP